MAGERGGPAEGCAHRSAADLYDPKRLQSTVGWLLLSCCHCNCSGEQIQTECQQQRSSQNLTGSF